MSDDLISLIYVSSATRLLSDQELVDILNISRENNKQRNITGMLLYKDGNFMQVLEGPEGAVLELYEAIRKDNRHKGVMLLGVERVEVRSFPAWEMGFTNMDKLDIRNMPGYSPFLEEDFNSPAMRSNMHRAHLMLMTFKENIR